jgi:GNAT superfamily N-acetyltransferase
VVIDPGLANDMRAKVMTPKVTMTDAPDAHVRRAIVEPLVRFNASQVGRPGDYRPLAIQVAHPETGEVLGGLWGETLYAHLHVDLLFVPEALRRTGIGRRLMIDAEEEAIRRGCRGAWLDTFSFQARGFYERLGYAVFGTIENYPPGHSRFFLKKTLTNMGRQEHEEPPSAGRPIPPRESNT